MPADRNESIQPPRQRPSNRRMDRLQRKVGQTLAQMAPGSVKTPKRTLRSYIPFGRPRVYRLKGYTTLRKVNRKLKAGRAQRRLWMLLMTSIVLAVVALVLIGFNPFQNLTEILRMIGIEP